VKLVWWATVVIIILAVFLWMGYYISGHDLFGVTSVALILASVYTFALAPRRRFDDD
jgi:hypothetical protein